MDIDLSKILSVISNNGRNDIDDAAKKVGESTKNLAGRINEIKNTLGGSKVNVGEGVGAFPTAKKLSQEKRKSEFEEFGKQLPEIEVTPRNLSAKNEMPDLGKLINKNRNGSMLGTAGEMVGGAIGGPVGAEVGKIVAEKLPEIIGSGADALVSGLKGFSDSLRGLQGLLGPIGVGFDLMSKGMSGFSDMVKKIPIVGELLGPMLDSLAQIPTVVKQITETLTIFASKAAPGQFKMLQLAVEDVQGAIGRTFVPIMNMMRDSIRLVGDAFMTILPSTNEMNELLTPLRNSMSELNKAFRELLDVIGPIIKEVLKVIILSIVSYINMLVVSFTMLAKAIAIMWTPTRKLLDLIGVTKSDSKTQSSVGAAAQPARFSDVSTYARDLQVSAFSQASTVDPKQVPKKVSNIDKNVGEINSTLQILKELINGIGAVANIFGMDIDIGGVRKAKEGAAK